MREFDGIGHALATAVSVHDRMAVEIQEHLKIILTQRYRPAMGRNRGSHLTD
ncbi:MAG: hypothetical protein M3M98_01790 [Nitrospirota bacterium]|nr:hypothetical protein [Nitrospirota bacterium]